MFVCNKIDTPAETFDSRSSDEYDSEEEETVTKPDKQKIVFTQLQQDGLIADIESYDTCSSFYGISAKNVRKDRREETCSKATELFSKFEDGLLGNLEETVKRETKQVVSKLIFLQMSVVKAMDTTKQALPRVFGPLEFDTAKSVEKSLYTTLIETIASEEKIGMLVNCKVLGLEEKFMPEALQFREKLQCDVPAEVSSLIASLQELEDSLNFLNLLLCVTITQPKKLFPLISVEDDAPFLRFVTLMHRVILDKTFNDLKRVFECFLNGVKDVVEIHSRNIANPLLRHALDLAYGSSLSKPKDSLPDQPSEGLFVHLTNLASQVLRAAVMEALIEGLLDAIEWKSTCANFNLADKQSRRKILELILSKFSTQRISHSISVAFKDLLEKAHTIFFKVIDSLNVITGLVSNKSLQLEEMAALYVPTVRQLLVQGFALQFLLNNGPLTLGPAFKSTKHGRIHECTGWAGEVFTGESVVKVIEEEKVEADVWAQTAVDLINTM